MRGCLRQWRGKHDWRGPGMTSGRFAMLRCCRCGMSYAAATADERPIVAAAKPRPWSARL